MKNWLPKLGILVSILALLAGCKPIADRLTVRRTWCDDAEHCWVAGKGLHDNKPYVCPISLDQSRILEYSELVRVDFTKCRAVPE